MNIVRQSSYRHVYGTPFKQEYCFLNLRAQTSAWDQDFVKANGQFFAVPWQAGGGGSIAVFKMNEPGKQKPDIPTLSGHAAQILNFDFNPFNDNILASCSMDGTVKIWGIPEDGLKETQKDALVTLEGHIKKVGIVKFHPTANNVLLSAAVDKKVALWDIEHGKEHSSIQVPIIPQSVDWNKNGSLYVSTHKDRKLRVTDPRQNKVAQEVAGHQGMKGSRCVWLKKMDKIFTVGFTKLSERHMMLFDPRKMEEPMTNIDIDVSSGIIMPFFDEDTSIMYLAGKGDGNIRYYEIVDEAPYMHYISAYKSSTPQRGMGMVPKYALDTSLCEVTRLMKLESNALTPVMFQVPRKSTLFQHDIYPETFSNEPSLNAEEFFEGKDADPKTTPMHPEKNVYKAKGAFKLSAFQPKVKPKAPKPKMPPKTNNPKQLLEQNEELRKRVEALEKENFDLKQKVKEFESKE